MSIKLYSTAVLFIVHLPSLAQVSDKPKEVTSPLLPIIIKSPVAPPTPAQAKDRLLWYKGKKVNDSVLVTTDATLILHSVKRDIVIVQSSSAKDPSLKIIKRMGRIVQDKNIVINSASAKNNGFLLYPLVNATMKEFDRQNEEYGNALRNVISLPQPLPLTLKPTFPSGGYASVPRKFNTDVPTAIKQAYDALLQKKKSYPPIDFPPPPKENLGLCYQCDGLAQNQYSTDSYKWHVEFSKYESELVNNSLSIFKTLEQLKLHNDPEAIVIEAGLEEVIKFAFARMKNKVELLIRRYANDFERLRSIINEMISLERQKQLMGIGKDESEETMKQVIALLDRFDEYLQKQMASHNYDVALNITLALRVERQKQLLGGVENNNALGEIIERWMAFNRFKMTYSYDVAWNEESTYGSKLRLESEPFYYTMIPEDCKLRLIKNNANALVISEDQLIEMKVLSATAPSNKYVGALKLKTHYPTGTLTFCDQKGTLTFHNSYGDQEKWKATKDMVGNAGGVISEGLDKAFEIEEDEDVPESEEENDFEQTAALKEIKVSDLNTMKAAYENGMKVSKAYDDNIYTHKAVVKIGNGTAYLIDEKIDGRKDNPYNYSYHLENAWLIIKLDHDPLPYKKAQLKN